MALAVAAAGCVLVAGALPGAAASFLRLDDERRIGARTEVCDPQNGLVCVDQLAEATPPSAFGFWNDEVQSPDRSAGQFSIANEDVLVGAGIASSGATGVLPDPSGWVPSGDGDAASFFRIRFGVDG